MLRTLLLASLLACVLATTLPLPAHAEIFRPVVIYQGDIQANSFNLTVHEGVALFARKTGIPCKEILTSNAMDIYMQCVQKVCAQGYSPVFLLYGNHVKDLLPFIRQYPKTRFVVMGTVKDEPNMFSLNFAEHEGSFLAGALAAMASKSGTIGFISVSDLPLMRRFACGFRQGAKYVDPKIDVLTGFTGSYKDAWFDGNATAAMADKFMDQGADVIYQAAGGAGPAVLEAAAKRGKLGIGVDRNQNGLFPGHVLTSMLKRTDQVVYAALMQARRGIWRDNIKYFGVTQDAVGLAFDENNAPLVSPEMRKRIAAIKSKIAMGEIRVHDYVTDNTCPQ
ncbi:MAG: BMP family ABC transporter substrate-binding protein [Desulfovibrio sp.]|uniref:BMP family ABC transporter substrate-binding protein n=1 Tax=Desulfovibrio sp. 7SRBS1 TaxID=3378064 RepID=UPI003B40B2CA